MERDPHSVRFEVDYWMQIVEDIKANASDMGEVAGLLEKILLQHMLSVMLVAQVSTGVTVNDVVNSMEETTTLIEQLGDKLVLVANRHEGISKLIVGRMRALRKEVGIDGEEGDSEA
jgi:hypothetical protein